LLFIQLAILLLCRADRLENTSHGFALSKPKQSDSIAVKEKFIHAKVLHSLSLLSILNYKFSTNNYYITDHDQLILLLRTYQHRYCEFACQMMLFVQHL